MPTAPPPPRRGVHNLSVALPAVRVGLWRLWLRSAVGPYLPLLPLVVLLLSVLLLLR